MPQDDATLHTESAATSEPLNKLMHVSQQIQRRQRIFTFGIMLVFCDSGCVDSFQHWQLAGTSAGAFPGPDKRYGGSSGRELFQ